MYGEKYERYGKRNGKKERREGKERERDGAKPHPGNMLSECSGSGEALLAFMFLKDETVEVFSLFPSPGGGH